ncbi:CGNR zinc finger domain-containing protein [Marinobacter sp. GN3S48]|uniref:CGNR zinc finger domain-containing protein n=1 Tax=Marinobacter sp. GN3S48 TaxID=3382302 RepID=UPI00387ACE0B
MKLPPDGEPLLLADHPALDLVNTICCINGEDFDFWNDDKDVVSWLERLGLSVDSARVSWSPGELLSHAKQLRSLIEKWLHGAYDESSIVNILNNYLTESWSHAKVTYESGGSLHVERCRLASSVKGLLGPLSESIVDLISNGDPERIRQCQHDECILWFYDRTKARRRRWCSMALCGNRHKVGEYRKRQIPD